MPPRKRAAKAATPPPPPPPPVQALPFAGCKVSITGSFRGYKQSVIEEMVSDLGGEASTKNFMDKCTHVITSPVHYKGQYAFVRLGRTAGLPIVSLKWLIDCKAQDSKLPVDNYLLEPVLASTAPVPAPIAPPAAAPISVPARGGRKRTATAVAPPVTTPPQADAKRQKTDKPVNDEDEADDADEEDKADVKTDVKVDKSKKVNVPVDDYCQLPNPVVYIDDDGMVYDASLNQTNAGNNNNKFYRIQILQSNGQFYTWTRWGRVGERGQFAYSQSSTFAAALKEFESKFRSKSGLKWENRNDNPKPNKYAYIERNYEDDDDEEEADVKKDGVKEEDEEEQKPAECTLLPPVQKLMELIFNQKLFAATMTSLNYDANKLPLGKLSKTTISRGFQMLKDLSALFDDPATAPTVHGCSYNDAVERLSNLFYSVIPHAFGRNRPPVLQSFAMLKKEIELLESLSDMKDAELLMKADRGKSTEKVAVHPADRHYKGLNMEEMEPLDHGSAEYKELASYLVNTRGQTHSVVYEIEDIFRIKRHGEKDRFDGCAMDSKDDTDTRLLWHGSRVTNFGGILGQGLRIAPPEAPVTGYMFGKGIYLADMSSKSAGYCNSYISHGTGLLLLCEAKLGAPMQKLTNAQYDAGETAKKQGMYTTLGQGQTGPVKWKDAGAVNEDLKGVQIPDLTDMPGATGVANAYLQYNEYIVYDVSQVRLRYLFRVKM